MLTTFIVLSFVFLAIAVAAIVVLLKIGRDLLMLKDNATAAHKVLADCHDRIDDILRKPLFYDNTEVREVLMQIKASRDAIAYMSSGFDIRDDNNEE